MRLTGIAIGIILTVAMVHQASAAIALDRTRVIFNGGDKSVSLNVSNENKQLPYLVQAWMEDLSGQKINNPFTIVPPLQRVEAGSKSQVKVQSLPAVSTLPQDRESVFYFNLREIPPRSEKPNTLQIALQTRIKLFYRPEAIVPEANSKPWQENIVLSREGARYKLTNPGPYFVTIVDASADGMKSVNGFSPVMVAPFSSDYINLGVEKLGRTPVLTYVNDFGGHPKLAFNCSGNACSLKAVKDK